MSVNVNFGIRSPILAASCAPAAPAANPSAITPRRMRRTCMAKRPAEWRVGNDPDGIRTRVAALKGPCPRPLDDGAECGQDVFIVESPARTVNRDAAHTKLVLGP